MKFSKKEFFKKHIDKLKAKGVMNWNLFDKFLFFKLQYFLSTHKNFIHSPNFGLLLIKIKRLNLSNEQFVDYVKWLRKNNKLQSFLVLFWYIKKYKLAKGIKDE